MESDTIIRTINQIEDKFPVEKWLVEGFYIWPYIRFKLGSKMPGVYTTDSSKIKKIKERYLKNVFKYLLNNIKYFITERKKEEELDFIFIENGTNRAEIQNSYYFTRTDPIRDLLEEKGYSCKTEILGYNIHPPLYKKGVFFQFSLDYLALSSKIRRFFGIDTIKQKSLPNYNSFLKYLVEIGVGDGGFKLKDLLKQISFMQRYRIYFEKKLKKQSPKAVFILCYYSTYGFALISACKNLNIPVIDIQHGIQSDYHFAYGKFKKILARRDSLLPDIFYVWGKKELKTIDSWKSKEMSVFIGGNNYLDIWKDDHSSLSESFTEKLKNTYSLNKYKKVILFTVHPLEGYDKEIVEAIKESPKDWFWFVRLHPTRTAMLGYIKERIGDVKCGIAIEKVHTLPLYALLKVSDVHITERSTTIMEASVLGIKSIMTLELSKDLFRREVQMGMAQYVNAVKKILYYIESSSRVRMENKDEKKCDIMDLIKIIEQKQYAPNN